MLFSFSFLKGKGPVVALLCEYDALPGMGHACGHNLIAECSVAAGLAVKQVLQADSSLPGKVFLYRSISLMDKSTLWKLMAYLKWLGSIKTKIGHSITAFRHNITLRTLSKPQLKPPEGSADMRCPPVLGNCFLGVRIINPEGNGAKIASEFYLKIATLNWEAWCEVQVFKSRLGNAIHGKIIACFSRTWFA